MRILIIEDEKRVSDFLNRGLHAEGHFCVVAGDGESGMKLAKEGDFDIILLDLLLPKMHGFDVCQNLRMCKIHTPLLILTALDGTQDIVSGLRLGADAYMTKPFSFEALLAQIEALHRRSATPSSADSCLRAGNVVFDLQSLEVSVGGLKVHMTAKELAILELLMSRPGKLFSRERILSNVWGLHVDPLTNVVDVYIAKLRKKLHSEQTESLIETVRGLGYRLKMPDDSDAEV